MLRNLYTTLLIEPTRSLRFWFGLSTIGQALLLSSLASFDKYYAVMGGIAPQIVWVFLFLVNGSCLVYGSITKKYGYHLLLLEGVLGVLIWSSFIISHYLTYSSFNSTSVCMLISIYLFMRYPTHHRFNSTLGKRR